MYDYLDAQEQAEMWMEDMSDEELEASVYRKMDVEIPGCIRKHSKRLNYEKARAFLRQIRPRSAVARQLIRFTLEMDAHGRGHEHAWPGHLTEEDVPVRSRERRDDRGGWRQESISVDDVVLPVFRRVECLA